ncbi:disulfide bond formation protein B [Coralloluteibacterium stylophorae]|uniref:Disulfide bond formation protein B n=1 Tax=Coralloluteibacterium stylophorae TaxID=1776034 RepID=A0A8J7VX00_9GAMM|nr:disulfide bond formation protein B [Coralloluteibacterium stylophorae]MBS7456557.1 disulfide bond formation protein B [Coralloluteibacterium stylophorae]
MKANPLAWPFRLQCALGALVCVALLAYALYLQYVEYLDPCPLCIFQRVAFIGMAAVFALGALHGPRSRGGRMAYGALAALCAAVGIAVAGRHVWLQSLPADEVPSCSSMGLDYMLDTFPVGEVVAKVFTGSGECAAVDWSFLGLGMPAWTLLWYVLLAGWALWIAARRR